MRSHVWVSSCVFALAVAAHVARFFVEGTAIAFEPAFALSSLIAIGMCAWGFGLLMRNIPG